METCCPPPPPPLIDGERGGYRVVVAREAAGVDAGGGGIGMDRPTPFCSLLAVELLLKSKTDTLDSSFSRRLRSSICRESSDCSCSSRDPACCDDDGSFRRLPLLPGLLAPHRMLLYQSCCQCRRTCRLGRGER